MNSPLVSIITPCYNGEEFIKRFMNSVLEQTYNNIELIIINDGSDDKTEEIIKSYRNLFLKKGIKLIYEYQSNSGQAAALNRGLKLFSGEYMTWVDSDDELMPDYVSSKVKHFQTHPECAFCYGKIEFYKDNMPDILVQEKLERLHKDIAFVDCVCFDVRNICFTGYMVKKECLKSILNNMDIYSGQGGQNAQLLLPLSLKYGEPDYVPESVYKSYIRNDSHSHSQDTTEKQIEQLYNYEKVLVETLNKMTDDSLDDYKSKIHCYYARWRFGCSFDSKNPHLVKRQYKELKETGQTTIIDFLRYIKFAVSNK